MIPMSAINYDLSTLTDKCKFVGQIKYDGVRVSFVDGQALSKSLTPFPNLYLQAFAKEAALEGFDGEIIIGSPLQNNVAYDTSSAVMTIAGIPEFTIYVFDLWNHPGSYQERYDELVERFKSPLLSSFVTKGRLKLVANKILIGPEEVRNYEENMVLLGHEGIILRGRNKSTYKFGKATMTEKQLLKVKRLKDTEAKLVGFKEQFENTNPHRLDKLGHKKKSYSKAGKIPMNTLGSLLVEGKYDDDRPYSLAIGVGFTAAQRKEIWDNRQDYINSKLLVKFSYLPMGTKHAPRQPRFLGWRDPLDMGTPV